TDHTHRDGHEEVALVEPLHLLHETLLEKRDDYQAATERERAGFQEERQQLAEELADATRRSAGDRKQCAEGEESGSRRRLASAEGRTEKTQPPEATANEAERYLGLNGPGDEERRRRERPFDPVLHPELRQPIARVQNQRDHGRTDAVKDRAHRRQTAEID